RQAVARQAAAAALPVLLRQRPGEERLHGLLRDLRRGSQAGSGHGRPEARAARQPGGGASARGRRGERAPGPVRAHRRRADGARRPAPAPGAVRRGGGLSEGDRDPELERFVEAIEAAFRARRGKDQALAPRDFALARGFFDAGVPLATVLVALDAAFERDPGTATLAALRRRIEELAPARASARAARGAARQSLPELAERLDGLRERLLELPGRATALPLAELGELADLVAVSSRPNWDYLRERLRRLDDLVAAAAIDALTTEQQAALRDETRRAAERQRGKVDER